MPAKKSAAAKHTGPADTTAAVNELMDALGHPHKDAITELRRVILGADGAIAEGVKWNAPSFRTTEYFATTHLRTKQGVGVILHLGAKARALPTGGIAIQDPESLLTWLAKDRALIEFADAREVKRRQAALRKLLRQWIKYV